MLRTCCKPRKSKDWNILHRSYTKIFYSTPKKSLTSIFKNQNLKFLVKNVQKSRRYFWNFNKFMKSSKISSRFVNKFSRKCWLLKKYCKFWLKKYFFRKIKKRWWEKIFGVEIFFGHSFDAKCSNLSIYEVPSKFWAL